MNRGYLIEEELMYHDSCYERCNGTTPGQGMLERDFEGNTEVSEIEEDGRIHQEEEADVQIQSLPSTERKKFILTPARRRLIKTTLIDAMLRNLNEAIGQYARHECQGCKIDHPSQKYHAMCLWTKPKGWVEDYGLHRHALNSLNIYDIIKAWDDILFQLQPEEERRYGYEDSRGLEHLTPRERVEAYKNWTFMKDSHYKSCTDPAYRKLWNDFWKQKLIEFYDKK